MSFKESNKMSKKLYLPQMSIAFFRFLMLLVTRGSINRLAKWFALNGRYHPQHNQILVP
uniref:Uncharacterized protein n=1 Tax=Arundo donax TaxID=35708 RepID=A0A0A9AN09_ARUDO